MTVTTRILQDTPELQVIEDSDPIQGWKSVRVEYKPGTPQHNREVVRTKALQVRADLLRQRNAWSGMTAAQRLDTVQNLIAVVANLVALVLDDDITDEGV